jgi:hypothetical protein
MSAVSFAQIVAFLIVIVLEVQKVIYRIITHFAAGRCIAVSSPWFFEIMKTGKL